MVQVFIDEGGQFTPTSGWSVVCALVLPDTEVSRTRRKFTYLTRDWPRLPSGELKGGSLDKSHLEALVDLLFQRNGLLHAAAIDMTHEDESQIKEHKLKQSQEITASLTPDHYQAIVDQAWALRRVLEGMPTQLYVQSILMTELTAKVLEETTLYFAQRRAQEIGKFTWTIDAKDPHRITTQEKWWQTMLGPLQETRCRERPLRRVNDPEFDYSYFNKAYLFEKMMWHPDKPREHMTGFDVKKILSDRISFRDSRSDILLQAADILTSFFRRILMRRTIEPALTSILGRLQILCRVEGVYQNATLFTFRKDSRTESASVGKTLGLMSLSGRSMLLKRKKRQ